MDLIPGPKHHNHRGHARHPEEKIRTPQVGKRQGPAIRHILDGRAPEPDQDQVNQEDDHRHRQEVIPDEQTTLAPGTLLVLEEIHGHGPPRTFLNRTPGTRT